MDNRYTINGSDPVDWYRVKDWLAEGHPGEHRIAVLAPEAEDDGAIPEGEPGGPCAECFATGKEVIREPEGDWMHGSDPCENCDGTGVEPHRCPNCDAILRPGSFVFIQENVSHDAYQIERVGTTLVLARGDDAVSYCSVHTNREWGQCNACHQEFPLGFEHAEVAGSERGVLNWEGGLS